MNEESKSTGNTGRPRAAASVRASAARLSGEVLLSVASIANNPKVAAEDRIAAARLITDVALTEVRAS